MRKLNIRVLALALAFALCLPLSMPALAAEAEDEDGTLAAEAEDEAPTTEAQDETPATEVEDGAPANSSETLDPAPDDSRCLDDPGITDTGLADTGLADVPADITDETSADIASLAGDEVAAVTSFSDVPRTHGFYTAIMDCASKGITSGYSDGTFRPTNTVTRAQFCVMLARAFWPDELKQRDNEANKALGWFVPASKTLFLRGALAGTSFIGSYTSANVMDAPISRYDMAMLMTNIMRLKGFTATDAQKTEAQAKISDYKSISSGYQDAVKNVFALGIITGYSDGSFGGSKNMNRGQGCVVIYRMMQYTPAASKPGTGDNGTYDDGKPTETPKPSTGTGSGSTSTETKPTESKTPTLLNGKAITEANVTAILNELQRKYPEGTSFANGYTSAMRQSNGGGQSEDVRKVTNTYTRANGGGVTSISAGCGGWAAFVSDSIFGTSGMPARRTDVSNTRPGDILITVDANGKLTHVAIATGRAQYDNDCEAWYIPRTHATSGSGIYRNYWDSRELVYYDMTQYVHVYTRYPA